jgi:hypothetical protein
MLALYYLMAVALYVNLLPITFGLHSPRILIRTGSARCSIGTNIITRSNEKPLTTTDYIDEVALWERRASQNSNDSNVFFQLGKALERRLDDSKAADNQRNEELEKIVTSFERAAQLERDATESGDRTMNGNLIVALRNLGIYYLKVGRSGDCLGTIDEQQRFIARKMPFAVEDLENAPDPSLVPKFEWIYGRAPGDTESHLRRHVAIRTFGDCPLLDADAIRSIRESLFRYREEHHGPGASRFTMQYSGNSDYHVVNLCANDPQFKDLMDRLLTTAVYPLVRASFHEDGIGEIPETPLCVYDAIVVRYDASQASKSGRQGASLPLVCMLNIGVIVCLDD